MAHLVMHLSKTNKEQKKDGSHVVTICGVDAMPAAMSSPRGIMDEASAEEACGGEQWYDKMAREDLALFTTAPRQWFRESKPPQPGKPWKPHMHWGWRTSLEEAVRRGDCQGVLSLCKAHTTRAIEFMELRALTAVVAARGDVDMMRILMLDLGMQINGTCTANDPRFQSLEWRHIIKASGNNGETPLNKAAQAGHTHLVTWLLAVCKADANLSNNRNVTPLHIAVINLPKKPGMLLLIKVLCAFGADPNATEVTPLQLACLRKVDAALPCLRRAASLVVLKHRRTCMCCDQKAMKMCECQAMWYCSEEHQQLHWQQHQATHMMLQKDCDSLAKLNKNERLCMTTAAPVITPLPLGRVGPPNSSEFLGLS